MPALGADDTSTAISEGLFFAAAAGVIILRALVTQPLRGGSPRGQQRLVTSELFGSVIGAAVFLYLSARTFNRMP
ncbi:hypothetical protein KEM60_02945 [Austwickia sp. TVS 96-490-7B]|nr:hypothetical protein [Austwickia sp. TVS 96-490-7B]